MAEWTEVKSDTGLWNPATKGEQVEGEVVEIKQGQFGGIQIVLETAQHVKVTTPSHRALQSRLKGFQVGDFIKIVFTGTDLPKLKGNNPTRLYTVFKRPGVETEEVV
jgi:hypothetical protein